MKKKQLKKKKLPIQTVTVRALEGQVTGGGYIPAISNGCLPGGTCSGNRSGCMTQ